MITTKNFWKDDCPDFKIKQGKLFGSSIFECEEIVNDNAKKPAHILVWFNENSQTQLLASNANNFVIKLLCQRHKILSVYLSAQQDYKKAREHYRQLEEKATSFHDLPHRGKKRLHSLEQMLLKFPKEGVDYAKYLRNLNDYKTTIFANRENYSISLNNLRDFLLPEDDIAWLELFHKEKSILFEQQINTNIAYLTPAQPLFQQLIDNVQGLTQIETLKHEFDKQERIEFLVVFIATTLESAAVSIKVDHEHHFSAELAKELSNHLPEMFNTGIIKIAHYFDFIPSFLTYHVSNMLIHLGVGLGFGIFAWLILWIARQIYHKKHK